MSIERIEEQDRRMVTAEEEEDKNLLLEQGLEGKNAEQSIPTALTPLGQQLINNMYNNPDKYRGQKSAPNAIMAIDQPLVDKTFAKIQSGEIGGEVSVEIPENIIAPDDVTEGKLKKKAEEEIVDEEHVPTRSDIFAYGYREGTSFLSEEGTPAVDLFSGAIDDMVSEFSFSIEQAALAGEGTAHDMQMVFENGVREGLDEIYGRSGINPQTGEVFAVTGEFNKEAAGKYRVSFPHEMAMRGAKEILEAKGWTIPMTEGQFWLDFLNEEDAKRATDVILEAGGEVSIAPMPEGESPREGKLSRRADYNEIDLDAIEVGDVVTVFVGESGRGEGDYSYGVTVVDIRESEEYGGREFYLQDAEGNTERKHEDDFSGTTRLMEGAHTGGPKPKNEKERMKKLENERLDEYDHMGSDAKRKLSRRGAEVPYPGESQESLNNIRQSVVERLGQLRLSSEDVVTDEDIENAVLEVEPVQGATVNLIAASTGDPSDTGSDVYYMAEEAFVDSIKQLLTAQGVTVA